MGWLQNKLVAAKVSMCVKEVKWHLEAQPILGRARLLAMAQFVRMEMLPEIDPSLSAFDDPLAKVTSILVHHYETLETLRNNAKAQAANLQRAFRARGAKMPAFAIEHAELSNRALEVWMCTLGGAIVPARNEDVREIWTMLIRSSGQLPIAIEQIYDVFETTARATGQPLGAAQLPESNFWAEQCEWIPAAYS